MKEYDSISRTCFSRTYNLNLQSIEIKTFYHNAVYCHIACNLTFLRVMLILSYLRYLGWYAYIGVQHILFCICSSCLPYFVSFSGLFISACISSSCVFHILSVSLDCTYLIALYYSLTFICQFL